MLNKNILSVDSGINLVYLSFKESEVFLTSHISSNLLGISVVYDLEHALQTANMSPVEATCGMLPMGNKHAAFPYTNAAWKFTML